MSRPLDEDHGYDTPARGLVFSLLRLPVLAAMLPRGRRFDRHFPTRRETTAITAGTAILSGTHGPRTASCAAVSLPALTSGLLFLRDRHHLRGHRRTRAAPPPVLRNPCAPQRR
ncbi:hypothetical protein AB0O01_00555 [Streptomyces sp. NPDC093252]|uniref:hypothetical protein n=1 Tax=Streptomyces sp. NPDC093252 TaxID=3154980 RepID=UPI00343DE891